MDANALLAAGMWLQGVMLGSIAVIIATIAVAVLGMLMFAGRVDWRRGAGVVLGCFLIFGTPVIAAGLLQAIHTLSSDAQLPESPVPEPAKPTLPNVSSTYDPYAGAAVPAPGSLPQR